MKILNDGSELVAADQIRPHPRNVNQGDLGAIHESLGEHGFYGNLVVQRATGLILAGNHRYMAGRQAGMTEFPVTWVDVDDDEALRILLVDNRTTRLGYDDPEQLAELLQGLAATDQGFAGTGYDGDALDELLRDIDSSFDGAGAGSPDDEPKPKRDVTCPHCGQQFRLGSKT